MVFSAGLGIALIKTSACPGSLQPSHILVDYLFGDSLILAICPYCPELISHCQMSHVGPQQGYHFFPFL